MKSVLPKFAVGALLALSLTSFAHAGGGVSISVDLGHVFGALVGHGHHYRHSYKHRRYDHGYRYRGHGHRYSHHRPKYYSHSRPRHRARVAIGYSDYHRPHYRYQQRYHPSRSHYRGHGYRQKYRHYSGHHGYGHARVHHYGKPRHSARAYYRNH